MSNIATKVEVKRFRLADLDPAAYNPRGITDDAARGLRESIETFGVLELPVVNVAHEPPRIVSGHQRIRAMLAEGYTHGDCIEVRMDDAAEIAANLALNNPAIRGAWDATKAMPSIPQIEATMPKGMRMGLDTLFADLRSVAARMEAGVTKAKDATTAPAPEVVSQVDMLYTLGRHRLICGSFSRLSSMKKRARACITDPPYGVAYQQESTGESLENDDLEGEAWSRFLSEASALILKKTNGACYVFMSSKEQHSLQRAWEQAGGVCLRWLLWVKDRFTLSRGDYHHMYEPLLYGARAGVDLPLPKNARTNVLECPKPALNDLHPTQKPVELIRMLVDDSTDVGDLVLEPFAGSGTTLAVCEEQGRSCYAAELSPKHCDTIRKRWAEQVHGSGCDWQTLTPGTAV